MKYEVTNATQTPRVLHDVNNRGVLVPTGQMRIVDLHDHDANRLMKAESDEVKIKLIDEPKPIITNAKK